MVAIFWKRKPKKSKPDNWPMNAFYEGMAEALPKVAKVMEDQHGVLINLKDVEDADEFEDFEIDRNEVKFLIEVPHFCDHHRFTLDSVHFHAGDPDRDDLMFSCKNTVTVAVDAPFGEPQEEVWACSATRTIERKVFWEGPVKIREQYVDPEWERNMASYVYNQNMRAFEREMYGMSPIIHIP